MNQFFNSLNDVTSELFIIFKELKENYSAQNLQKAKTYFETSVDLMRLGELLTTWCPEIFLEVDQVHSTRLLNFITFTLNSVFVGEVQKHIDFFAEKRKSLSATIHQYLSPFVGILVKLYMRIMQQ